jgi:hypothetical protein
MELTDLPALIAPLFTSLPFLIVMAVGFVVALVRRPRHPRVSMLAMIGFGGHALTGMCAVVANQVLVLSMMRGGTSSATVGAAMGVFNIGIGLINAIWWGVLIAAIFRDRPNPGQHSAL